ncbi:YjbF family lipoprotein [Cycloclasticus pugetii]|uniref:YjbF family lipoprotein n=1 Tax=Cycloclasticus pugetii TaxID=34068 RepID=UPI003A929699
MKKMPVRPIFLLAPILVVSISGCSSNFKSTIDSISAFDFLDESQDANYIASIPYASAQVSINDSAPLLLILADATQVSSGGYRLKWLSADGDSVITESGRIVQTAGLAKDNLETLSSLSDDPTLGNVGTWQARYDWSPGYRYGFTATVKVDHLGDEVVITDLWRQEVNKFTETVVFDELDAEFTNTYWRAPETDKYDAFVVKSVQYLGPNMDKIEMLMVKPFVPYHSTDKGDHGGQS